jgi:hypothetical protein
MKKTYLKKEHKKICHLCKLQLKEDGDMWDSFEDCVEYTKRHSMLWRDLYKEKYGVDYRKKQVKT